MSKIKSYFHVINTTCQRVISYFGDICAGRSSIKLFIGRILVGVFLLFFFIFLPVLSLMFFSSDYFYYTCSNKINGTIIKLNRTREDFSFYIQPKSIDNKPLYFCVKNKSAYKHYRVGDSLEVLVWSEEIHLSRSRIPFQGSFMAVAVLIMWYPFFSMFLELLRHIKRIADKLEQKNNI